MKLSTLITLLLAGTLHAQSIQEVEVHPAQLENWLNRSSAVEIQVPPEATASAFSFGPDRLPLAMASMLHGPVGAADRRLQVLIVPPDQPGGSGICDNGGLAGIFVNEIWDGMMSSPNYMPFCTPYPDDPVRDEVGFVVDGDSAEFGEWRPIYLHAWNSRAGMTEELDPNMMFTVQVSFTDKNSTEIPNAPHVSISELLHLDSIKEQLMDRR